MPTLAVGIQTALGAREAQGVAPVVYSRQRGYWTYASACGMKDMSGPQFLRWFLLVCSMFVLIMTVYEVLAISLVLLVHR